MLEGDEEGCAETRRDAEIADGELELLKLTELADGELELLKLGLLEGDEEG